ncbi:MAG: hypothetical protein WBA18_01905 [Terracidiphilus sp.]
MTKHRSMDPLLLIGSIILVGAALTWIVPAGRFERVKDPHTGRTLVVPGSYRTVPRNPVGPWGAVMSIPQGMIEAAEVVFFVLLTGAAITVVESTGAIGNFLYLVMRRLGHRPLLVLAIASLLFLIGGASDNMYEEILAFIPVLCLLMRRMGLDPVMAVGVSVGTASVAAIFSPCNSFTLGISQPVAELPLFSAFAFRSVFFVLALTIWGAYLAWYAMRNRQPVPPEVDINEDEAPGVAAGKWSTRDLWVLVILNAGMALVVLGGIFLHWGLREFSAVFVVMGVLAGLLGGLGWRGTSRQFAEGLSRMALAASLVGFARAISVVLANGLILDTIANVLFSPLKHLPVAMSAVTMFISESVLAFPMPSDSGRALMSLPILVPLADLLGLSRQMAVLAYQYSSLVASLITPTTGALLAMLVIAKVSYGKWLRFMALPFVLLSALAAIALVVGVKLGIQ